MTLGRTPWVDRNLKSFWPRIAAKVPEEWMPELEPGKKFSVEEYGCGHYGCVTPTGMPDIVFKMTSDVSEARFVVMAQELPKTEGIVEYYKIFALKDVTQRRRPVFVLWREAAKDIGILLKFAWYSSVPVDRLERYGYDEYSIRPIREGVRDLELFQRWAREARNKITGQLKRKPRGEVLTAVWKAFEEAPADADPRHYRGLPRIGIALRKCWDLAMSIANTDVVYPIGAALGHYMDEGILLADVHLNNIGRDIENDQLIITDPGHAVEFHPRWTKLPEVPVI